MWLKFLLKKERKNKKANPQRNPEKTDRCEIERQYSAEKICRSCVYIYIYIGSGCIFLYGCHLLRRLYNILYFLWLYYEFFIIIYNILKIAELDCCQIIILSIYVPSTHAYTHVLSISRFALRNKVTIRLLKLFF